MKKFFGQSFAPPVLAASACLATGAAQLTGVPLIGIAGVILGAGLIGLAAWCLVFRVWPATTPGAWTEEWQRLRITERVLVMLMAACPGVLPWLLLAWPGSDTPVDPAIAAMVSAGLPIPVMTPAAPSWGATLTHEGFAIVFVAAIAAVFYGLFVDMRDSMKIYNEN